MDCVDRTKGGNVVNASEVAITQTYEDVRLLIIDTVQNFCGSWGGYQEVEDMIGEANIVFLKVYDKWDESRGQFTTLLVTAIKNRLIDIQRKKKRQSRGIGEVFSFDSIYDSRIAFKDFLPVSPDHEYTLSESAEFVAKLALYPPKKVVSETTKRGNHLPNLRRAIRDHLKDLGWTGDAIRSTFLEIQETFS